MPAPGWLLVPAALAAAYLFAAVRERRRSPRGWSGWRTASWLVGSALLGLATSPPLAAAAHEPRGHVAQHLLFGAFAPLALVLAAPVTLTLRALGPRARRPLVRLLRARWLRVPTHPATAAVLDVGALYLVHLTPLYRVAHGDPAAHLALHAHYLAAGALFAWSIAGPDPAPGRPGLRTRAAVLVAAVAAHATLAKLLYAHPPAALGEPAAVRAAAQLMYYGGDVAELLLAVALFAGWYRARRPRPAGSRHPAGPAVRRPAFRGI